MGKEGVKIEIMDTTLRDGEQTSGVSFVPHEKLMIARLLLEDLKVDRVEVASARVSDGEFEAVKMICDWAARRSLLHKVEVLGFVDGHTSVDWIQRTGCRVINLLCTRRKSSEVLSSHRRIRFNRIAKPWLALFRNQPSLRKGDKRNARRIWLRGHRDQGGLFREKENDESHQNVLEKSHRITNHKVQCSNLKVQSIKSR
jgi:hypothetical protein